MRKTIFITLAFTCMTSAVFSQINVNRHIKWSIYTLFTSDNTGIIYFKAKIDSNFHLWSQHPGDKKLTPPTFNFEENKNVILIGETKENGVLETAYFPGFQAQLKYFSNQVEFVQIFKYNADTKLKCFVDYQLCNDNSCLPPEHIVEVIDISYTK